MHRTLAFLVGLTAVTTARASFASEPAGRTLLSSERQGSLAVPKPLMRATLPDLCKGLPSATDAVYTADIAPAMFKFGAYDLEDHALVLRLDHALPALDGTALLSVMDRDARFEMTEKEARAIEKRHDAKELTLTVTFQVDVDDTDSIPACFSPAQSDQWALHVEALTFTLRDGNNTKVASHQTASLRRLEAWVRPGAASVRLEARPRDGVVDAERATVSLGAVRSEVETCTKAVVESVSDPVSLAYVAKVSAGGTVTDARPEIVTAELDDVVQCVQKALFGAELPSHGTSYEISLLVAIDRPGFDTVEM